MASLCEKYVCQGVLMIGESWPRVPLFLSFHSKVTPTIMLRTLITVEKPSSASKVKVRIFIIVDGPPEAGESIVVLIDYNTSTGIVLGTSCPIGILPKPPDKVAVSIISTHGDHF